MRSYGSCCRHGRPMSTGSKGPEACLLALGNLEPRQLLQVWGKQAFGQREFWSLLSRHGLQEGSAVSGQAWGNQALVEQEFWSLISYVGFRECSSVVLLLGELCLLVQPYVACGAAGAMGPKRHASQGEGNKSCSRGECGALSSYVCLEAGLTTKRALSIGAWSCMVTS
jgi:hypothetical protein